MAAPIVFIHRGNSFYLPFTLGQARFRSGANPLVLLGDASNAALGGKNGVQHELLNNYPHSRAVFEAAYVHLSLETFEFEQFCFSRWFLLRDYVVDKKLEAVWHLDSDVMLYTSLAEEEDWIKHYDAAYCHAGVPAVLYITATTLHRFCDFILDLYTQRLPYLHNCFENYKEKNPGIVWGGITDMHAFWLFAKEERADVADISRVQNGAVFDQDIHQHQGFVMDASRGEKLVRWQGKQPYFVGATNKLVTRANSLHWASSARKTMHRYYTGPGLFWLSLQREALFKLKALKSALKIRKRLGFLLRN